MERLNEIGFAKVGEWCKTETKFTHNIQNHLNERKLLYAFACNGEVLYIGKTTDTLKSRMTGYKNANSTQKTNVRVKAKILELLKERKTVEIFIFVDKAKLTYKGYNLCLASALEDILISQINPKWNYRGIRGNVTLTN